MSLEGEKLWNWHLTSWVTETVCPQRWYSQFLTPSEGWGLRWPRSRVLEAHVCFYYYRLRQDWLQIPNPNITQYKAEFYLYILLFYLLLNWFQTPWGLKEWEQWSSPKPHSQYTGREVWRQAQRQAWEKESSTGRDWCYMSSVRGSTYPSGHMGTFQDCPVFHSESMGKCLVFVKGARFSLKGPVPFHRCWPLPAHSTWSEKHMECLDLFQHFITNKWLTPEDPQTTRVRAKEHELSFPAFVSSNKYCEFITFLYYNFLGFLFYFILIYHLSLLKCNQERNAHHLETENKHLRRILWHQTPHTMKGHHIVFSPNGKRLSRCVPVDVTTQVILATIP